MIKILEFSYGIYVVVKNNEGHKSVRTFWPDPPPPPYFFILFCLTPPPLLGAYVLYGWPLK